MEELVQATVTAAISEYKIINVLIYLANLINFILEVIIIPQLIYLSYTYS